MPAATMIAGPNGSGKSTLTMHLVELGIELGDYLNADADYALVFDNSRSGSPIRPLAEFKKGQHRMLMQEDLPNWWVEIAKAMELK